MTNKVSVFFYGGLINTKMQERVGVSPTDLEVATVAGFDLTIRPYVNLVRSPSAVAFGQIMRVTHEELSRLYGQLKVRYEPEAVLALDAHGRHVPALCYIAPQMPDGIADREHVLMLLEPAKSLGFPAWYLDKISSFLPPGG